MVFTEGIQGHHLLLLLLDLRLLEGKLLLLLLLLNLGRLPHLWSRILFELLLLSEIILRLHLRVKH